ncbi:MAG TPA: nuclear transport factor 2 family protein [Terracidiphilus sp.]|jgi:SnoaL-like domain|nr:nuclear transport factor 2 family protein [Terracidiphilus sp.]
MNLSNPTRRRTFLQSAFAAATAAFIGNKAEAVLTAEPAPAFAVDALYSSTLSSTTLQGEVADRLCIRKLVDAWAHYADRRIADRQAGLFTPDGVIYNYEGEPESHSPTSTLRGRAEIVKALAVLNQYKATLHMNGQSDIAINGGHAVGETYCLAHQLSEDQGKTTLEVLGIRYYDRFVRENGAWFFIERKLIRDWTDKRPQPV